MTIKSLLAKLFKKKKRPQPYPPHEGLGSFEQVIADTDGEPPRYNGEFNAIREAKARGMRAMSPEEIAQENSMQWQQRMLGYAVRDVATTRPASNLDILHPVMREQALSGGSNPCSSSDSSSSYSSGGSDSSSSSSSSGCD